VQNNNIFYCKKCSRQFDLLEDSMMCSVCGKKVQISNNIPVFSEDIYWGKIPEAELKDLIENVEKNGFDSIDKTTQKKIDFTFDEDRADWRFFIPALTEMTVLDVGAGLGRISIPLARISKQVIACDQSLSRMRFLEKRANAEKLNNLTVFVGDIYDLPLKDNSVDLIVMNGVLEWVGKTNLYKNPKDAQIRSLEICKKLLKKDGHLYIGIENRLAAVYLKAPDHGELRFTSYMPRFLANIYTKLRKGQQYRTYTYSKKGYEHLLFEAGFKVKPNFYLLYPGYNLPRVIIPYNNLNVFRYVLKSFKNPGGFIKKVILFFSHSSIFIRLYRLFFFSFGIIIKND